MAAITKSSGDGLAQYLKQVDALDGRGVKVGIQSDAGSHEGTSILDIAIYNELGTADIPARPFIRDFAQKKERTLGAVMDRMAAKVTQGVAVDAALSDLGQFAQDQQQAHVRASKSWAVPNAPSTVAQKGSDVPLVNHSVLVNAIRWEKV
ncbi:hypothetical protein [Stenotrophomonas maltophilia]|uniref:hypothetical protein n=1 Tax=Stenotrophomonas maltophilia TaxID=40324 RepID=UPI0006AC8B30|nr:hypothetical protein [Stenotrophomonas maltophilia]KOQ69981.1 hypothetical protein ABW43_07595 [Stenotrophomonas maltophilia]